MVLEKKINLVSIDDVKDFTSAANACKFDIDIKSGKYVIDAKSIMGIFSIDLSKTVDLEIHTDDASASEFLAKIEKFLVD